MKNLFTVVSMLVLIPAVLFAQDMVPAKVTSGYLVRPGDKIEGKVLGESDFDFTVVVDQDGRFMLPYVDVQVQALCRSEKDLTEEVKRHYSKFLRNPMLSVAVSERNPPTPVTISGEIRAPQRVEMRREARLIELISFSGGFTENAGATVQVFRIKQPTCANDAVRKAWDKASNDGKEFQSSMYSRASILQGRKEANPIIYPGDVIIVDKADPVYMTGEVVQQTGVYIKEGGLSLTQALAMVGGLRRKAKTKDVKIYRLKGENQRDRETISVNLELIKQGLQKDIMLAPYDIVEVDKARDSIGATVLKIVTGGAMSGVSSFATGGATKILY